MKILWLVEEKKAQSASVVHSIDQLKQNCCVGAVLTSFASLDLKGGSRGDQEGDILILTFWQTAWQ